MTVYSEPGFVSTERFLVLVHYIQKATRLYNSTHGHHGIVYTYLHGATACISAKVTTTEAVFPWRQYIYITVVIKIFIQLFIFLCGSDWHLYIE